MSTTGSATPSARRARTAATPADQGAPRTLADQLRRWPDADLATLLNLRTDLAGFDASYHVVFADGSTADGVITVLCSANRQRPSEVQTLCTPQ